MSKSLCVLPWVHVATSSSGSYRVCCNSTPNQNLLKSDSGQVLKIYRNSVEEAWNSKLMKSTRLEMLNGQSPEICNRCESLDLAGAVSPRSYYNELYKDWLAKVVGQTSDDGSAPLTPVYIDLRLGNNCNLRCVMCNPHSSSQWQREWSALHSSTDSRRPVEIAATQNWPLAETSLESLTPYLDKIDMVYLTGGEPMLAKGQVRFLELLVKDGHASRITLKYNTNVTILPERLIEIWRNFKKVLLNLSVDAVGDLNTYIRFPTDWEVVDRNLRWVDQTASREPWLCPQIHCCVQNYNILGMVDLLKYLATFEKIQSPYFNILDHPNYLNIRALPAPMKALATSQIEIFAETLPPLSGRKKGLLQIVSYMNSADLSTKDFDEFVTKTKRLEALRGNSIAKLVPEFASYLGESKNEQFTSDSLCEESN